MSLIMTAHGWQQLAPLSSVGCYDYPFSREPIHTKSLIEDMGLIAGQGEAVADQYCEAIQRFRLLPKEHPSFVDERRMLAVMGTKTVIPGFHVRGWPKAE